MDYTLLLILFIIGTIFGSFVNVVIYRIPRNISILYPPSACTKCAYYLKWYENIPIISYLLLKGKCSKCKAHISLTYMLVELICGLLFLFLFFNSHNILHFAYLAFIIIMFIAIAIIDYKHFIIPDKLLIVSAIASIFYYSFTEEFTVIDNFKSALILFSSLFLLRYVASKLFKKESMGMGDIKLGALIGFLLGWKAALLSIFFGFYIAACVLSVLFIFRIINKDNYIPFGPFILGGMFVYTIWGSQIVNWYIQLMAVD